MDTVREMAAKMDEMPRFDDGMANVTEPICVIAQALASEVMDTRADEACADGSQRNGYRERTLAACVGKIALGIPKPRAGSYYPEPGRRRSTRREPPCPQRQRYRAR